MEFFRKYWPFIPALVLLVIVSGVFAQEIYEPMFSWGTYGAGPGQFNEPYGMTIDSAGNVYIADARNDRIQKFAANGTLITSWGSPGTGPGQFNYPTDVTIDRYGQFLVTDYQNKRIQVFTTGGAYQGTWAFSGSPIAIDGDTEGNVDILDEADGQVEIYNGNYGYFVKRWGSTGSGNLQFMYPADLYLDSHNYVYIADTNNHRIQKSTEDGGYITQWGSFGTGDGQFNLPWGITADAGDSIYVCDGGNHRIQKFYSNGTYATQWGSYGREAGQLKYPHGIAVNASGIVYVSDQKNYRVQVFGPAGSIQVDSVPIGAAVILDGVPTGKETPATITNIPKGEHSVAVTLDDYTSPVKLVQVATAQRTDVLFDLERQIGSISVDSVPQGAIISLDSVDTGKVTPSLLTNIYEGEHVVSVVKEGYLEPEPETVTVTGQQTSEVFFGLQAAISLRQGWNFVSVPFALAPGSDTAIQVFGSVDTDGHSILVYDAASGSWAAMAASDRVKVLDGIWIYAKGDSTVLLTPDPDPVVPPATRPVFTGWNAIGFSGIEPATARDTLLSVKDSWTFAIGFDPATRMFEPALVNGGTGIHSDLNPMRPGKGYWLGMVNNGTLLAIGA